MAGTPSVLRAHHGHPLIPRHRGPERDAAARRLELCNVRTRLRPLRDIAEREPSLCDARAVVRPGPSRPPDRRPARPPACHDPRPVAPAGPPRPPARHDRRSPPHATSRRRSSEILESRSPSRLSLSQRPTRHSRRGGAPTTAPRTRTRLRTRAAPGPAPLPLPIEPMFGEDRASSPAVFTPRSSALPPRGASSRAGRCAPHRGGCSTRASRSHRGSACAGAWPAAARSRASSCASLT
jgi:hypothetical protein